MAMDTYMQLDIYGDGAQPDEVKAEIERLDKLLSATDKESDIFALNQNGEAELDGDTAALIKRSLELCEETDGCLDITVYPLVEEWGFIDKNYKIPEQSTIDSLLKNTGFGRVEQNGNKVKIPSGFKLDLGAVAKGYAADKANEMLRAAGVDSALLNLGGTVLAYGKKQDGGSWRVGITDPDNTASYMGVVECEDKIVVTSGNYERYFEGSDGKTYCHIIDPKTGYPADNGITSVTVISDDGTKNDALSTALFVMGKDTAVQFCKTHSGFDCVILTADKKAYVTKDLKDNFSLSVKSYDVVVI